MSGLAAPAGAAELVASGPERCRDAGELTFRVKRALGAGLESAPPLRFDVRFEGTSARGYRAQLVVAPAEPPMASARRRARSAF